MYYILSIFVGYTFGCIQTAYFLTKYFYQTDIKSLGSKNAGASNVTMSLGKKAGFITAFIDIFKCTAAILLIKILMEGHVSNIELYQSLYLTGVFVVIGHNFPFFMNFDGGKGTAASLGFLFGLDPHLGFTGTIGLIVLALTSNYIVVGSALPLLLILFYALFATESMMTVFLSMILIVIWFIKHKENFNNILNGSEKKVRDTLSK